MAPRDKIDKHWQVPANKGRDNASERMSWINDVVSAGEDFNASLTQSQDVIKAIDMISGRSQTKLNQSRSTLTINREKRALRETIAGIADIRTVDAFVSDNPAYQNFLAMQNKIWKSVYFESKFPVAMKRAAQWLTAGGYSFISPVYRNTNLSARAAKQICFDVFSANDVLSFQMPENNDLQGAYGHTLIRFMPEFEACSKFKKFASQLRPVARRRYSGNAAKDRLSLAERFRNGAQGENPTSSNWASVMDEIRYTHVRDLSINETSKPMPMGMPGALESYIVPFVGQDLPTPNFLNGFRVTRKATEEDCYLYPNGRTMISQKGMNMPMYDGPSFSWHGMFPLARFSADEWPWEPGYSLARDIFSLAESRSAFMRGMEQTAKQRFDPSIIYDKNAGLPRKTMEQFDPYEERGRLGVDGAVDGAIMRPALPDNLLNIPAWGFQWNEELNNMEDYMLGSNAMQNLARAKVASSDDALQQAMEEAGPIVKDVSHGFESPMQDIMEMCMYDVAQYYPTGRIMAYVGADRVSRETFDLDPSSIVASHVPGEDPSMGPSIYTRMERTKITLGNMHPRITPGSLHGVVQTQQKLLYMQLQRAGFMIDSQTVSSALDIGNWGELDGNTVLEKWKSEQMMKLEFATKMQELQTALQPQAMQGPPVTPLAPGAKPAPGRPPSGNKPPELKTKGSAEGPRAVITES